ncbi:hypothetical protein CRU94_04535 [Arcobacter sp. AHV-9/2010]|uniref:hypothetical protein n=1 Tax=Arcobacter sp. AHV-9/2010 TaxID=2021861 RepID=UPI00100A6736|nr:hypothetical protein [Arcobacter sp. CECT 9299]RXJ95884.1 hypothetical protein CRU94_04535 [Arcobacter sp. CECT 9299]
MNDKLLYKYTSLKKFDQFVDMIINNRLFAAPFKKLNDSMEGFYLQTDNNTKIINSIIEEEK